MNRDRETPVEFFHCSSTSFQVDRKAIYHMLFLRYLIQFAIEIEYLFNDLIKTQSVLFLHYCSTP